MTLYCLIYYIDLCGLMCGRYVNIEQYFQTNWFINLTVKLQWMDIFFNTSNSVTMATRRLYIVAVNGSEFMAPYINPVIDWLIDWLNACFI